MGPGGVWVETGRWDGREREGAAPERPRPQHSPHSRLSDSAFNPHGGPGEAGAAVIGTAPTGK